MILKIKNLGKRIGNKDIISSLSLQINNKIIYGLLGDNGAGKTTTLGMISGLIRPTQGEIMINNLIIKKSFGFIGLVPHELVFFNEKSCYYNLVFYARLSGLDKHISYMRSRDLIKKFGLELNQKVGTMSNGMKKKLAIAQAVIHEPKLVLLDEPFGGLDYSSKVSLRTIIKGLCISSAVIISSHDLGEIEKICHTVGFLKNGKIVKETPINKIDKSVVHLGFDKNVSKKKMEKLRKIKHVVKYYFEGGVVRLVFDKNIDEKFFYKELGKLGLYPESIKFGHSLEDLYNNN